MSDPLPDPEMPTMFVDVRCDERNPGGYVAKGWNVGTGRPMFTSPIGSGGVSELSLTPCVGVLLVIYNGDTGVIESGKIIRRDATDDLFAFGTDPEDSRRRDTDLMEARLRAALADCHGDPNGLCPLCDDDVPGNAEIDHAECHPECVMASLIGHYGKVTDAAFWVENMGDPRGGLSARESALAVAKLVAEHGLYAVARGDFPRSDTQPAGPGDG